MKKSKHQAIPGSRRRGYPNLNLNGKKGYGVFSHAHSQIDFVVKYIGNKETHHQKKSFKEEYLEILRKNEIACKDEFAFEFFDHLNDWE